MTLEYWKEYPTFFQMSLIYKISPSSCYRNVCWVEDNLANHQDFQTLKNKINKIISINKTSKLFQKIAEMECKEIFEINIDLEKIKYQEKEIQQLKRQICVQDLKLKNRNRG